MKVLANREELEEALRWAEIHLPKSAFVWHWLKINLVRPGGKGTSEAAKCYADRWPKPNILVGIDLVDSYYLSDYVMLSMFTNLSIDEASKVENFLLEVCHAVGIKRIGGLQPQGISDEWIPAFRKVFAHELGLNASVSVWPCRAFYMPDEKRNQLGRLSIEAPRGFEFQRLTLDDCEFVDAVWPHRYVGSVKMFERRIGDFPSIGLREAGGEKRLASFEVMHDSVGIMNHLYTVPEFRRRGLAKVVELKLARVILEEGYYPIKTVVRGNVDGEMITRASSWWSCFGDASWLRFGDERIKPAYDEMNFSGEPLGH